MLSSHVSQSCCEAQETASTQRCGKSQGALQLLQALR